MPRRRKNRPHSLRPDAVSPPIKDEGSDTSNIQIVTNGPDFNESGDIEELPPHHHDYDGDNEHPNQLEISDEIEIRGIAALDQGDPEIQYLRQELHDVMRERRIVYLRRRIQRERQLLAEIQQEYSGTGSPTMELSRSVIGMKRQRSESTSSVISVRHARPPIEYKYRGRSINEFRTYMSKMEAHFYHHSGYYINDTRKIQEAESTLTDEMREQWGHHSDTLGTDRYTWQEFYGFFLDLLLRQPKRLQEAESKFRSARQRRGQSVRDFAHYLGRLQAEYPGRFAEWQKIEFIRSRVLEEIGRESRTYSHEPRTYEAFVSHLVMIEITIPERRAMLRAKLRHPDHV